MKSKHQLIETNYFIPTWKIEYLLLGTFNPEGGERVPYYYGRKTNLTWQIVSELFGEDFNVNNPNFFDLLKKHKIACIDMICSVEYDLVDEPNILGKGYSDSKIVNKKTSRIYNTTSIIEIINLNPGVKVLSTWGKGSNLKEWKKEIAKINFSANLASPSMAARVPTGTNKKEFILSDWKSKFI